MLLFRLNLSIFLILTPASALAQAESQFGNSNLLLGKAGIAGEPSIDTATLNPAQAGLLDRAQIQGLWGYRSVDSAQRYPGFEAKQSKTSGADPAFPIPRFFVKPTASTAIGGLVVPISLNKDIKIKELPMVIFGQENYVDINGQGKLLGFADISGGYRASPALAVGVNLYYLAIQGSGDIVASGSVSDPIASFDIKQTTTNLTFGVRYNFQDTVTIGLVTSAYRNISETSAFDTQFVEKDASAETDDGSATESSQFANPIGLGIGMRPVPSWLAMFDIQYVAADKSKRRFSVVDLKEKRADVYDTVSLYFGSIININTQWDFLTGFYYEPSAIGPGSQGADGTTGFGFFDLALGLGEPPSKPEQLFAAGARYQFIPIARKRRDAPRRFHWTVESGLAYSETSIGIDKSGEQPGAYLVKRIRIPIKVIYKF